jgi:hypothetical protein
MQVAARIVKQASGRFRLTAQQLGSSFATTKLSAARTNLLYGTLATPRSFPAGDEMLFAAGSLTVVLS